MLEHTQVLVEIAYHNDDDDDDDKLDLEKGDVVTVLLKRDSHWWIGELEGERGLFPANNVKEIKGTVVHVLFISCLFGVYPICPRVMRASGQMGYTSK